MARRIEKGGHTTISASNGFFMLLAVLLWLDEGVGLLAPALLAAAFHEFGHMITIHIAGGSVMEIRLTAAGAEMKFDQRREFSYWQDAAAAVAGPLASFLCAWIGLQLEFWIFAAMCMGQGIFNLLPVGPLDGGRVAYALIAGAADDLRAERVLSLLSALTVGLLFGTGLVLLRKYGNPTLILTAGWLCMGIFRQRM